MANILITINVIPTSAAYEWNFFPGNGSVEHGGRPGVEERGGGRVSFLKYKDMLLLRERVRTKLLLLLTRNSENC
jgi:hypothetical protein